MKRREIFLFGSRSIDELPVGVEKVLDTLMMLKTTILVGDCVGVDFAVQQYLYERDYKRVKVFTSNKIPRNIMGDDLLFSPYENSKEDLSLFNLMCALGNNMDGIKSSLKIPDINTDHRSIDVLEAIEHGKHVFVQDDMGKHEIVQHLYKNDLNWKIVSLYSEELANKYGEDSREFYRIKDIHMLNICDGGIAIWNGKSKATNVNINELIARHKKCTVFLKEYFK